MTDVDTKITAAIDKLRAEFHAELNRTISESDEQNGIASTLEFVAEGFRLSGNEEARQYVLGVARNIASGKGNPAPNPGPVTPPS